MTPERYAEITRLCQAALELNPSQRAAFLSQACAGDDELRAEVESLLSADEAENGFIDSPGLEVAAQIFAREQPSLTGERLGNYQILSQLGAGGMGEVYLAEDTRLKRKVALKLLPASFTQDAERVRRFEQEAQAASALNHPNILTIYDVGQTDTASGRLHYIAMEYIAGVTLRQRLTAGRLPLSEALAIVRQIAAALDTAHEAGIFHRDIKPENVMLRPDGLVKVLDFGLAKLSEIRHPPSNYPQSTASGMVMGTPRYMSPEQARGLKVDARSDVFSLGVVFYEMVTGEPAFAGASTAEVFAALLEKEPPPLQRFVPEVPARLQEIISRMLAKDREQRYPGIRAVLADLAKSGLTSASGENQPGWHSAGTNNNESSGNSRQTGPKEQGMLDASAQPTKSIGGLSAWRVHRLKWLASALLLAGVLSAAGYRWLAAHNEAKQPSGDTRFVPLIGEPGRKNYAAISPDETRIAFEWDGGGSAEVSPTDIYVKVIGTDGPSLRLTTAPENDTNPFWTPDGKYVTFVRERSDGTGDVLRVPASGGPEQKLAETFNWASWSPDGKTLAVRGGSESKDGKSIFLVTPETGQRTRLTNPEPTVSDSAPRFSPDGKLVAFTRKLSGNVADIFVIPASGGTPRQVTFENFDVFGRLAWTSDSREIVFNAVRRELRGLWRISVQGGPLTRVAVNARNPINPDISRQGNKLIFTDYANDSNLWLYQGPGFAGRDVPGKFSAPAKLPTSSLYEDQSPTFSPDGQAIVFASERSGVQELWMCDAEGKAAARQLTRSGSAGSPRWSYDGKWIAFDSSADGDPNIYVISAAGDSAWRRLTFEKSSEILPAWSRDGQWIYFVSNSAGGSNRQIYKMPAAGGEAKQITFNGGYEGFESPDGKLFYYTKGRGVSGIYSVPANGGEEKLVPELKDAGYWRSWTVANEGICFPIKKSDSEWAIRFFSFATRRTTTLFTVTDAPLWWMPGLVLSPDGRRLIYAHLEHPYDELMLMENFH
ncbi:MAG: serine/threonine-protein kinase [Blastocatellia bacterium]|nr:serine/threonine-protein kinase [Blastocatellia bacterium]